MIETTGQRHLLGLAIGPVQDFIAQARRSRDLWYGSHILSEIARASAAALADNGAKLVFPPLNKGHDELNPSKGPRRKSGGWALAVSNKVLVEVPAGVEPKELARLAIEAAQERWTNIAKTVENSSQAKRLVSPNVGGVWKEQVESLLEIYAAWTPLDGDFNVARRELDTALAVRKTLRDFGQQVHHRPGAPKSSFDGGRVTVLRAPSERDARYAEEAARLRIPNVEQLDAIGLIKRSGGTPDQFVPIANVGMATWLSAARRQVDGQTLLDKLNNDEVARSFGTIEPGAPHGDILCVDAQCLVESRLGTVLKEAGLEDRKDELLKHFTEDFIVPLQKQVALDLGRTGRVAPPSYVGVIVADGDHMGGLIDRVSESSRLEGLKVLRTLSQSLGMFAERARSIVDAHRGSLIYAGGDDVLAFVPLEHAVECAHALQEQFAALMSPAAIKAKATAPTLSVGLGVGHFLTGMADLLELGRKAEKVAKGSPLPKDVQRNALAILFDKRSGSTQAWRRRWDASPLDAVSEAIERVTSSPSGSSVGIPTTKLYQVRDGLGRLPAKHTQNEEADPVWAKLLASEVLRTLNRAGVAGAQNTLADFGLPELQTLPYNEALTAVEDWFALHIIARELDRSSYSNRRPQ